MYDFSIQPIIYSMEDYEDAELEAKVKIFKAADKWMSSNEYVPYFLKPIPLIFAAIVFMIFGFTWIALGLTLGYAAWFVATFPNKFRIATDLVNILTPSVEAIPDGLDNDEVVKNVLDESKMYETRSSQRGIVLQMFLRNHLDNEEVCKNGHNVVCPHNMDASSLRFWKSVANRVL